MAIHTHAEGPGYTAQRTGAPLLMDVPRNLAFRAVGCQLRTRFSRIVLAGDRPSIPEDRSLVIYSNHHIYHDGLILVYLIHTLLARRPLIWMRGFSKFPNQLLRFVGAMPFPEGSTHHRAATIRKTVKMMSADSRATLIYFPEEVLHPAQEGLLPVPASRFARLNRLFPEALFLPVALAMSGWHESRPTVKVAMGELQEGAGGREMETLGSLLAGPLKHPDSPVSTLVEGFSGPRGIYKRWHGQSRRS